MVTKKFNYCKYFLIATLILIVSFVIFLLLFRYGRSCIVNSLHITSSLTLSGLILGFFYYVEKQKNSYNEYNEKVNISKYRFLMNEIEYCDGLIEKLYHKHTNGSEIKFLADDLQKHCIILSTYFEKNNISLKEKDGNPNPLGIWNSFINTAEIVQIQCVNDVDKILSEYDERSEYEKIFSNVKIFLLDYLL